MEIRARRSAPEKASTRPSGKLKLVTRVSTPLSPFFSELPGCSRRKSDFQELPVPANSLLPGCPDFRPHLSITACPLKRPPKFSHPRGFVSVSSILPEKADSQRQKPNGLFCFQIVRQFFHKQLQSAVFTGKIFHFQPEPVVGVRNGDAPHLAGIFLREKVFRYKANEIFRKMVKNSESMSDAVCWMWG